MSPGPLIALIHATPSTLAPATEAFSERYPEARLWHLMDDRLVTEADDAGGLTPDLRGRMSALIEYAVAAGADAVQIACSMYGPVADAVTQPVPVVPSDLAMFEDILGRRPSRVGVLASLAPAAADTAERLRAWLGSRGHEAAISTAVTPAAKRAADSGDRDGLVAALAEAATELPDGVGVIVLAQYSLTPVVAELAAILPVPVVSPPHLAAASLATALGSVHR